MKKSMLIVFSFIFLTLACKEKPKPLKKPIERGKSNIEKMKEYFVLRPLDTANFTKSMYQIDMEQEGSPLDVDIFKYIVSSNFDYIYKYYELYFEDKITVIIQYPLLKADYSYHASFIYLNLAYYFGNSNGDNKGIYVRWVNRALNYDILSHIKIQLNPIFEQGIGKYTDTLYTNLDKSIIERFYPEFKGIYIRSYPKRIKVNFNNDPDTHEFYDNIEFL
jgi:hypothetical protein